MRACHTCQHLKRPPPPRRRRAAGASRTRLWADDIEPLSPPHQCLKLASSNAIAKEAARGTAALALLPSKETLSAGYFELRDQIDRIARQAKQQGSLKVALAGLNSIRPRGASILALSARQVGKTTTAAWAIAHAMVFMPGSLSVITCPAQRQSAEAVRRVRDILLKVGAKLVSDNVYALELDNGSRVLALPGATIRSVA